MTSFQSCVSLSVHRGSKRDHCGLVHTCWLGKACVWPEKLSCVTSHVVPSSVCTAPMKYQKGGAILFPIVSTTKILLIVNLESFCCLIYLICQWHIVFIKGSVCPDWKAVISYCPTWSKALWRTSGRIPYIFTVKKLHYFLLHTISLVWSVISFSITVVNTYIDILQNPFCCITTSCRMNSP